MQPSIGNGAGTCEGVPSGPLLVNAREPARAALFEAYSSINDATLIKRWLNDAFAGCRAWRNNDWRSIWSTQRVGPRPGTQRTEAQFGHVKRTAKECPGFDWRAEQR